MSETLQRFDAASLSVPEISGAIHGDSPRGAQSAHPARVDEHASGGARPVATEVSNVRRYVLRATYLLIVVGLGADIWPALLFRQTPGTLMWGVAISLLAAVTLMALIGIRYPVKMLPLLLFELTWKTIWLTAIALPLWWTGQLPPGFVETVKACAVGLVIFPLAIPWRYVRTHYIGMSGERWR